MRSGVHSRCSLQQLDHIRLRPLASRGSLSCRAMSSHDLLVVGPGVLGSRAAVLWKEAHPSATVMAQSNSDASHERLKSLGLEVRTKETASDEQYPFVLFAAPPSGSDDYPKEVAAAAAKWDGTGSLLFTSSTGMYAAESGVVDEQGEVHAADHSERIAKLAGAEASVLDVGGNVVRLTGLYHANRGPHSFFFKKGEIGKSGDSVLNLIHYDDAASIAVAILKGSGSDSMYRKQVFIGCDDAALTFQELVDACKEHAGYEGDVKFTGDDASVGKTITGKASQKALAWAPKYDGFVSFMESTGGKDWYSETKSP